MPRLAQSAALRREVAASTHIPYVAQVSEHIVKTAFGDYVQVFRLAGASFESADDEQLNTWHERLNVLWRNLASPQVALWTHLVRRRESARGSTVSDSGFADALAAKYHRRLASETLRINEIYLSVLYRPAPGAGVALLSRAMARSQGRSAQLIHTEALEACGKLDQHLRASLALYEPDLLGVYERDGRHGSRVLEFFAQLVNADAQPIMLPRAPLNAVLATTRLVFGTEVIEYRLPTETRVGAMLAIKEYPTPTVVGMFNRLLSAPLSFILTQSFSFLTKSAAQSLLQRQFNRMANAGDFAISQAEELKDALDALTSNEFVMGDHHLSLQVLSETVPAGSSETAPHIATLNDQIALARSLLADAGLTVAREDLALEAAYWSQLPGHFPMRVRKAPITSRNFAAMAPFHNYPTGRAHGNHWGEALAVLHTRAGSPYYFSLHASDPSDADGTGRRDTGHTFICGPTGSGKTVLIGFLVAMLTRQDVTQVLIDKDRGLEILVRALGGEYLPLKNGVPTGFNPLQLPPSADHTEFMKRWLRVLARSHGSTAPSVREDSDLEEALRGTLALPSEARRLSRLVEFLDSTHPEGLHARLARWCESTGGEYAWVFDNPRDLVAERLAAGPAVIGVDVTDFLEHELTRAPVTLYLFHLIRQLLDGRRFACWMDEFWRLLSDPAFEQFAKEGPKTWRKLNGVMCLATQSAGDVLQSPISRTIIEQTPTKIFFPNAEADAREYMEGFSLTEREFRLVKEQLEPGARQFLVKQGHHSVVCALNLKGFDVELTVLSGTASSVARLQRLLAERGPAAANWLNAFQHGASSGSGEVARA